MTPAKNTAMKHFVPIALLLLAAACGKANPAAAQKRWTLPLRQTIVTTDMASGRTTYSRETTWRYDEQERVVMMTLSDPNGHTIQNYLYEGPCTYSAFAVFDKETGKRKASGWANVRAEKDSLGRIVAEHAAGASNGEAEGSALSEYEYDAQGRVTRRTQRWDNGASISREETTYGERRKICREEIRFRGKEALHVKIREITYADDAMTRPLTERSETSDGGSQADVRSVTYTYDRRGRLTGKDEREGNLTRISSEYKYRNKRVVYETIEYYNGIARQKTRTETEYRH